MVTISPIILPSSIGPNFFTGEIIPDWAPLKMDFLHNSLFFKIFIFDQEFQEALREQIEDVYGRMYGPVMTTQMQCIVQLSLEELNKLPSARDLIDSLADAGLSTSRDFVEYLVRKLPAVVKDKRESI